MDEPNSLPSSPVPVTQGANAPTSPPARRLHSGWRIGVPVVAAVAGLIFVASARASDGTDLRAERRTQLSELVRVESQQVTDADTKLAALRGDVDRLAAAEMPTQSANQGLASEAGLNPASGQGLSVALDDASIKPGSALPNGATPDDVVVHQQDVQAVVNALWAGGATAMQLMDQRIISTSAVRCVGNTLILQGRVYAPPYTVTAVGDPAKMESSLDRSPDVSAYRAWVDAVGLGYKVQTMNEVTVPGYAGSIDLQHARSAS